MTGLTVGVSTGTAQRQHAEAGQAINTTTPISASAHGIVLQGSDEIMPNSTNEIVAEVHDMQLKVPAIPAACVFEKLATTDRVTIVV